LLSGAVRGGIEGAHSIAENAIEWGTRRQCAVEDFSDLVVFEGHGTAPLVSQVISKGSLLPARDVSYLQSTLLSCEATICHLPLRFNQVSVQTWHCLASGCDLSLPMACSLP
jgi:hypothetical protein